MTARELELEKIKRLQEIEAEKRCNSNEKIKFNVSVYPGVSYEFEGTLINVVSAAMAGLHQLEKKYPEAKELIDAAFMGYRIFRRNSL